MKNIHEIIRLAALHSGEIVEIEEAQEDMQKLQAKQNQLRAARQKELSGMVNRNPSLLKPTVPTQSQGEYGSGAKEGQPRSAPATQTRFKGPAGERNYFLDAIKQRDKLEQKPRGPLASKIQNSPGVTHDGNDAVGDSAGAFTMHDGESNATLTPSTQETQTDTSVRRADQLYNRPKNQGGKIATDLVGESTVLESIYQIMSGLENGTISNEMLDQLNNVKLSDIPEEHRDDVSALRAQIHDVLPTKHQTKANWQNTSPVVARDIIRQLDPEKRYKIAKSGGGQSAMDYTTIPEDQQDTSYDDFMGMLEDKIGKPQLREMLKMQSTNIGDLHDPTDIMMTSEEAIPMIQDKITELSEAFDVDPENAERNGILFKAVQEFKRELINQKLLMNYSLKQPDIKGGQVKHKLRPRNVNRDFDQAMLDDADFNLKDGLSWGLGANADGGIGNIAGSLGSLQWNIDDEDGKSVLSQGVKPHPGGGKHTNHPNRYAGNQDEPTIKPGAAARLGMMDTNFHVRDDLEELTGINFADEYGITDSKPFGYEMGTSPDSNQPMGLSRRFEEGEIETMKRLAREVLSHEGDKTSVRGVLPEGMESDEFIDKIVGADNLYADIVDELGDNMPKIADRDRPDPDNPGKTIKTDRFQDALNDDQRSRLIENMETLPDVNFRSKLRHKMSQLAQLRALQLIEQRGNLDQFGKNNVYRHALKMGDEYSPYIISG